MREGEVDSGCGHLRRKTILGVILVIKLYCLIEQLFDILHRQLLRRFSGTALTGRSFPLEALWSVRSCHGRLCGFCSTETAVNVLQRTQILWTNPESLF